ncbi:MAG: aldo/keto reductase [Taibaiella sp.]|nr:aldo/keto reductase [Taibaiella sp.]
MNTTFKLGNDLTINRMGFGAMRITGKGIWGPPEDHDEAIRVLKALPGLGVNFIDTADSYGPEVSEELIAEALYPYPAGMVIATKGGFMRTGPNQWHVNGDPGHLRKALEGSLKRLKLDTIDLYQLHRIDPNVPFEKMMEFLAGVQREGLVKHIGLSEVSIDQIIQAREYVDIVSVQNKYSIVYRTWEPELEYCEKEGIAFIPWNPINAGNILYVERLKELATRHNASVQQVALSWVYHRSPVMLLIPGTSKLAHLEENMKAPSLQLSAEEMEYLASAS